jgi:hypothetical protein
MVPKKGRKMVISYRPLPQKVIDNHNRTIENYAWLRNNWDSIEKEYLNRYIAVYDRGIKFDTEEYKELLNYIFKNRNKPDLIAVHVRPHNQIVLR